MPGTPMAVQALGTSITGVIPTFNAAAASNNITNDGRTFLYVKNASGASINVTLKPQRKYGRYSTAVADKVVAVPAGESRLIGPLSPGVYNYDDGTMDFEISATASVTVAVLRVPEPLI